RFALVELGERLLELTERAIRSAEQLSARRSVTELSGRRLDGFENLRVKMEPEVAVRVEANERLLGAAARSAHVDPAVDRSVQGHAIEALVVTAAVHRLHPGLELV